MTFPFQRSSVSLPQQRQIRSVLYSRFTPGLMNILRRSQQVRVGRVTRPCSLKLRFLSLLHFLLAHVSRDGRDLAIMTTRSHVFLIRDFERVCRGEASLETSGLELHLSDGIEECFYLAFEHGRVCVVTVRISYSGSCSTYSCAFF